MIKITDNLLTVNKYSRSGTKRTKTTKIAVHYVGNPGSTAIANRNYFNDLSAQIPDPTGKWWVNPDGTFRLYKGEKIAIRWVSAHYIVGLQGEIIRCVPDDEVAYTTNEANAYSIGIETCHPDSSGKFTEASEKSLAALVAYLLNKYGLGVDDVIRHYDVTGKLCPLYYVKSTAAWTNFKAMVADELAQYKTDDTKKLYCVQVGAFSNKANAEAYLENVKKVYPNAFIKMC